jgi:hypothetical protein
MTALGRLAPTIFTGDNGQPPHWVARLRETAARAANRAAACEKRARSSGTRVARAASVPGTLAVGGWLVWAGHGQLAGSGALAPTLMCVGTAVILALTGIGVAMQDTEFDH